jgi:hypothetical protein
VPTNLAGIVGISGGGLSPKPQQPEGNKLMAKIVKNPSGYHSSGKTLQEKAHNFGLFVKEYDWSGGYETKENGDVVLNTSRGESEQIQITWFKAGGGTVNYTLAGETVKCRNVSAAALIAQKQPDHSKLRKAARRKRANIELDADSPIVQDIITAMQGSLPFDRESTPAELKLVLRDKQIAWINRLSGQVQTAVVGVSKQFKVNEEKRYITFVESVPRGFVPCFRSVYLDSIVSVG